MISSLIVASDKELVNLIIASLPDNNQVDTIDNLDDAFAVFKKNPSDVIFADLSSLKGGSPGQSCSEIIQPFKEANPRVKIIVLAPREQIREAVNVVKSVADDYLTYPIDPTEINLLAESLQESLNQDLELDYLRDKFWKTEWIDIIHTRTPGMQEALKKIRAVAPTIATALLTGETGTGKGLMARIIHRHSNRSEDAFIGVHCGAIPDTLLESELFGHEKGAFTGAIRRKPGKFELARNGTIFLDEIGTISPSAQIKLLQVLQDGTFSRVGGEEVLTTDARIISATNADLCKMCDRGEFRKDLYYRLNVFPIVIPPLRERIEDIDFLVEIFLNKLNQKHGKNIQSVYPQVMRAFKKYHWPGNIRELENLMERGYILEASTMLTPESFPAELFGTDSEDATVVLPVDAQLPLSEARRLAIDNFERQYLKELFARNKGKVSRTAEEAGVSTRQLNKLMVKYGIRKEAFKE
jgi:DNA-binding NtrC family response regulator